MKLYRVTIMTVLVLILCSVTGFAEENDGEELFKKHCALCHPNGNNIIRPNKTLSKKDLEQYGIKTPEAIVELMRNPGSGMLKFTKETLSDEDAKKIAEYVLEEFD